MSVYGAIAEIYESIYLGSEFEGFSKSGVTQWTMSEKLVSRSDEDLGCASKG